MEILILLFAAVSIAHCADLLLKAFSIRRYKVADNALEPTVSVIVCAHNEKENLTELMPLLSNQHYSNYEVIVVLDRCTDESIDAVKDFLSDQIKCIQIDEVPNDIHPKKHGISQGIELAKGEWILLTDADCRPNLNWINEMAKRMTTDKEVVLGLSPYIQQPGYLNLLIQYETFMTALHFVSATVRGKTYMALGRNVAYRKSTFIKAGGFGGNSGRTGGDDDLLIQRLASATNVTIQTSRDSRVDSIPHSNWSPYFRQKTRHFSVVKAYSGASKTAETLRWTFHVMFWVFFSLCLYVNWQLTVLIFVGSFLMKAISINIVADVLEKRFNHLWLPFVDLTYVVIFPLLSLRSLLVKRITWK